MKKLILFLPLLFMACSEEAAGPAAEQEPAISNVKIAPRWNVMGSTPQTLEVQVSDPQGPGNLPATVSFTVLDAGQSSVYTGTLFDDGGFNSSSGDVLAGDGVYRNRIIPSTISSSEGTFTFRFSADDLDGNSAMPQSAQVEFASNSAPQLLQADAPESINAGDEGLRITVKAVDADGMAEIAAVTMDLKLGGVSQLNEPYQLKDDGQAAVSGDLFAGDSVFTLLVDSSFAAGREGSYELAFSARDIFDENSNELTRSIELFNQAGNILALGVPQSIDRPAQPGVFNRALVTAAVDDPQSLADVDSVYFFSRRPDGELANGGNPLILVDNGLPFNIENPFTEAGDETAADGTYSLSVLIDNSAQTGFFLFTFYMRDKAGNLSAMAQDSIEVR